MSELAVTRIINATVLIELPGGAVLTDPYFDSHWFMRFDEPIGLSAEELPELAAILGGHSVFDHWQPRSLRAYRHHSATSVYVANKRMERAARRAGFTFTEVLRWGEERRLAEDLTVRSLPGEHVMGLRTSCYLISSGGVNVFVGTEARSLTTIREIATAHRADVAILPVNGMRLLGRPLVMDAPTALEAARHLGAHTLVPIHYSQRSIPPLLRESTGAGDLAIHPTLDVRVEILAPGRRFVVHPAGSPPRMMNQA